ncbi:NAD(P)/FAD-dependent oxidoreductase [Flavobacterium sp. H122]|uniref:NAD(P)/FAD-dependent oxidoreductase n=1 Tax=Flavobacterium sp. H122 TaxID=2529860 RepID=UPI0010A99AE1|nr:NAD(P)-binding protein [Flavobacterium sp. H122]
MNIQKKIAIVGAGTAGSAAAIRLRQLGHEVHLIERNGESSRTIGESVPGAVVRLLYTLGFNTLADVLPFDDFRANPAIAATWGSDEWFYKDSFNNPEGGGWQIVRSVFDANLRQKATELGAHFYTAKFDKIEKPDSYYRLELKKDNLEVEVIEQLDGIIDASGRNASVLRKLGIEHEKFQTQMAVFGWFKIPEEAKEISLLRSTPEGWWYCSLLPDNERVIVFHGLPKTIAQYQRNPELFINDFNSAQILDSKVSEHHLITELQTRDASFSIAQQSTGDNWLAVGDASLGFDPISSQGIFFALYSAVRGAEAIVSSDSLALENYSRQINQIAQKNHDLRMQYYTAELRYHQEPYWAQYFE